MCPSKGLRLKVETTVGTETTRWVSDRSKRLIGPKRPVTDGPFCGSVCSARTWKKIPVNRVTQRVDIVV